MLLLYKSPEGTEKAHYTHPVKFTTYRHVFCFLTEQFDSRRVLVYVLDLT